MIINNNSTSNDNSYFIVATVIGNNINKSYINELGVAMPRGQAVGEEHPQNITLCP